MVSWFFWLFTTESSLKTVKQKECLSCDFGPLHVSPCSPPASPHRSVDLPCILIQDGISLILRSVNKKKNEWQHKLIISLKWLDYVQISRSLPWIGFAFEGSVWKNIQSEHLIWKKKFFFFFFKKSLWWNNRNLQHLLWLGFGGEVFI